MKTAILLRKESSEQGTFGLFSCEDFRCWIAELPWKNNLPRQSCIPPGSYKVIWTRSPKYGQCYQVMDVPNRGHILIHKGNYVGDTTRGWKSNSEGCLLPAKMLGSFGQQRVGMLSAAAVYDLVSFFNKEDFQLEIQNAFRSDSSTQ